jgi:hypothetical protein
MAALDFPSSPAVGQTYAPGGGQPSYVWNGTAWMRAPAILGAPTAGYRNVIINPRFDFAQRPAPGVGQNGRFFADRWFTNSSGTTNNPFLNAMPPGTTPWPLSEAYFYHGITVASVAGAGNFAYLVQKIENVRQLAGKRCTLSFWSFADAAKPISVELLQAFGGGGGSATVSLPIAKVTLGTGFQRYILSFDVPSIAGKTIGANGDDCYWLIFWLDAGTTYNGDTFNLGQQSGSFYFACVQLEEGPVATPFEIRPWHAEYQLCMRYYETGGAYMGFPAPGATYSAYFTQWFKTTKRAVPTIVHNVSGYSNATGYNPLSAMVDSCGAQLVAAAIGNAQANWSWTANAEL